MGLAPLCHGPLWGRRFRSWAAFNLVLGIKCCQVSHLSRGFSQTESEDGDDDEGSSSSSVDEKSLGKKVSEHDMVCCCLGLCTSHCKLLRPKRRARSKKDKKEKKDKGSLAASSKKKKKNKKKKVSKKCSFVATM